MMNMRFFVWVSILGLVGCATRTELPRPTTFDAAQYLGRWYEIARLPVFYQPDATLAVAEYAATEEPNRVSVLNRSVSSKGEILKQITGKATLASAPPPGRFTVSFPGIPALVAAFSGPNYHVVWVNATYTRAIVGNPARTNLWILSRDAILSRSEIDALLERASQAGFDTAPLLIAPWDAEVVGRFETGLKSREP